MALGAGPTPPPCLLGSWHPQSWELRPGAGKQAWPTQLRALRCSGWVALLPQRRVWVLTPMSVPPASDRSLQRCQVRQGGTEMGPLQGRVSLQGGRFGHSELGPCDDGGRGAMRRLQARGVGRPQRSGLGTGHSRLWGLPQTLRRQEPPCAWGLLSGFAVNSCRGHLPGHRRPRSSEPGIPAPSHGPSVQPHPGRPWPWAQPLQGSPRLLHEPSPSCTASHPGLAHAEVEAVLWPRWGLSRLARPSRQAASLSQPRSRPSSYRKRLRNGPRALGLMPTAPPKSDLT